MNAPNQLAGSSLPFAKPMLASDTAGSVHGGTSAGIVWPDFENVHPDRSARPDQPFLRGRWIQVAYAIIDACFIATNFAVAFAVRFHLASLHSMLMAWRDPGIGNHYGGFFLLMSASR